MIVRGRAVDTIHTTAGTCFSLYTALLVIFLSACGDTNRSAADLAPLPGCRAFACHPSAPLSLYPPASGEHRTHLGLAEYGPKLACGSCHSGYDTNLLHKNGFINGYNWLTGTKASGMVVYFGADVSASSSFDRVAGTCSGTGPDCHDSGASGSWYEGAGGTCGNSSSCHLGPPLSQFPPATGAHAIHRYKNRSCSDCHYNYFNDTLHRDGDVNASALDPKMTVTTDIVDFGPDRPSASWNNTMADCSSVGCHGDKNWYSYTSAGQCPVCHAYPPLSRSYPSTGRHGTHRGEDGIICLTCHSDYAAGGYALHNNGAINGSSLDPLATVFGNIVFFSGSGSYSISNGNCSSLPGGCHGTENWWSGDD